jgi:hypothetical protein
MTRYGRALPMFGRTSFVLVTCGLLTAGSVYGQAVTGAGTANRLTKWTGTSTLGNSVLTEAAGRIGVGSTAPVFNLEVRGTTSGLFGVFNTHAPSSGGGAGIQALVTSVPTAGGQRLGFASFGLRSATASYNSAAILAFASQPWTLGSAAGSYLTFETTMSNTATRSERMRIAGNGNVGIGIANPASKLSVAGVIQSTTGGVKFPDGTVQTTAIAPQRLQALEAAVASLQAALASVQADNVTLKKQVASLQASVTSLETKVQTINSTKVMALEPYVEVAQDERGPLVRWTGVNLQIVNGMNSTETVNGLGNLIVGYDESAPEGSAPSCETWDPNSPPHEYQDCVAYKTGSHNLVTGSYNTYIQYGGFVAGTRNTLWGAYASISGGSHNRVETFARSASISGGSFNVAEGDFSSISGGNLNDARGDYSSITGGSRNESGGNYSSISGGDFNRTSGMTGFGWWSSIAGGTHNYVSAWRSSISGGGYNKVFPYSDIDMHDGSSISGGYGNTADAAYSSISGGKGRTTSGEYNWVAGALVEPY